MQVCEHCTEPIETQSAVRRNNRVLRRVNRVLRTRIQTGKSYSDTLFATLCESGNAAENALRRIWEKAGIDCSPDDYDTIVEKAVAALAAQSGTSSYRDPEAAD